MTAAELKASILDRAVHGLLVPQDPNDEPAAKSSPIDNPPYELPQGWVWVRLGEVIELKSGQDLKPSEYNDKQEGIPYITGASNICNGEIAINRWTRFGRSFAIRGDLLLSCKGTVGAMAFLSEDKVHIARQIMGIRVSNACNDWYVRYFIETSVSELQRNAKSLIPGIARNDLLELPFPLPPLAEQKRIVAKIEELMPLVEEYGKAETELAALNDNFPTALRKSILQHAVEGRLTARWRNEVEVEEPAAELLAKIAAEKKRLQAAGKIKKQKPLPPITDDEKPFPIPDGWEMIRIGDIGEYKKGPFGSALTKRIFIPNSNTAIKVYEQKNAIYKNASLGEYYIPAAYFESKMKGFEVLPGDIIVSCAGTIGETYILPDTIEKGIINQALMRMRISKKIDVDYFLLYFDYILKHTAISASKGSAMKNIPPFDVFKKMIFPLPPLAEQKAIVERVEELLALVEKMKE